MNLLDFSKPAVVFDSKETVSKVASKMFDDNVYNVVITTADAYKGIVTARDIAKRNVNNPEKIEIKQFIRHVKPVSPEMPINDIINSVITNNYSAVPISHDEIYILTKLGILNIIKDSQELKKKKAGDLMRYPYCVSMNDNISTVISVLKEMDVSRVPIIGKGGKIEGIVTTLDLLRGDITRHRSKTGEKYGEKHKSRDNPITSIMSNNMLKAKPSTPVKNIIELMLNKQTETILIEEKNKIVGIITPTEILKMISGAKKEKEIEEKVHGIYVRISGIGGEDDYIKSLIDSEITHNIKKFGKIIKIDYIVLHITTNKTSGQRKNYSVKGRLITEKGYFFAKNDDWDLTKAVRRVMNKFEREIMKYKGKRSNK